MNITEIIWFGRADAIAEAATQTEADERCRNRIFHGVGEAVASDEPESSGEAGAALGSADSAGVLEGSGVASLAGAEDEPGGRRLDGPEGGGGRDVSTSGGKIGAEFGAGALWPGSLVFGCSAVFFFSAS